MLYAVTLLPKIALGVLIMTVGPYGFSFQAVRDLARRREWMRDLQQPRCDKNSVAGRLRARQRPKPLWPVIRRKLDALHLARTLQDLRLPAGNRLEALKGDRAGTFSVRVNQQYRITFRFEGGHAACAFYQRTIAGFLG